MVIDRATPGGPPTGYTVWFRLNRALPETRRPNGSDPDLPDYEVVARPTLGGPSTNTQIAGFGAPASHCYSVDTDGDSIAAATAGDPVTFSLLIGGGAGSLTVRAPFIDELPEELARNGEVDINAPYARALKCRR